MGEPSLIFADQLYAVERLRQLAAPGLLGEEQRRLCDDLEASCRDAEAELERQASMLIEGGAHV